MVVGIVGLGLMGGSFALALKEVDKNIEIVGYDHNKEHTKDALSLKIIDKAVEFETLKQQSDVIVFAIPVGAIKKELSCIDHIKKDCVIIDFGSTKENIIKSINPKYRKNLVASHPMAGTEYSGPKAAFSSLYKDKIVVLCDIEDSAKQSVQIATSLFNKIGMKIVYMNSKEHDRHAAFISHMPHIISYSLANSVLSQEDKENILVLAAGGFRDMSRLAKSPPKMWRDIFAQNRETLLKSLEVFENELETAKELIKHQEWDKLCDWLKKANSLHHIFT